MDKKTIIGVVLMSLIFIGYVVYNSKQQAKYQEYMSQVQEIFAKSRLGKDGDTITLDFEEE